MKLSLLLLKS